MSGSTQAALSRTGFEHGQLFSRYQTCLLRLEDFSFLLGPRVNDPLAIIQTTPPDQGSAYPWHTLRRAGQHRPRRCLPRTGPRQSGGRGCLRQVQDQLRGNSTVRQGTQDIQEPIYLLHDLAPHFPTSAVEGLRHTRNLIPQPLGRLRCLVKQPRLWPFCSRSQQGAQLCGLLRSDAIAIVRLTKCNRLCQCRLELVRQRTRFILKVASKLAGKRRSEEATTLPMQTCAQQSVQLMGIRRVAG